MRKYDAELWMIGMDVTPQAILVPPGISESRSIAYCDLSLTDSIPATGVYAFANLLHSHVLGRKLFLRIIRNGVELKPIDLNKVYDFNYQQTIAIEPHFRILPNDTLIMECVYDSSNVDYMTYGGYSTREEMCLSFLVWYKNTFYV